MNRSENMKKVGKQNKGRKLSEEHKAKLRAWTLENKWKPKSAGPGRPKL